jgi:hypothetical protein
MKPYQKAYALAAITMVAVLFGLVATAPDGSHFPLLALTLFVLASVCVGFGVAGQFGPDGVRKYVHENF